MDNKAFIRGFIEKVAAAPKTSLMWKAMKRMDPLWKKFFPKDRPGRVREYRDAVEDTGTPRASLAQRLKSFKHWKRTGEVPAVSIRGGKVKKIHTDVKKNEPVHRPMSWSKSKEPIKVVHYGKGDVSRVAKDPVRPADRHYIVPGKQRIETKGSYFGNPGVEFKGYGDKKLTVTIPKKSLLRTPARYPRQEAILPRSSRRSVIGQTIENRS